MKSWALMAAIGGFCELLISPASAAYMITIQEIGPNVIASGSGSIDTTGFAPIDSGVAQPFVQPAQANIVIGSGEADVLYASFAPVNSSPTFFGSSPSIVTGTGVGMPFGFGVPGSYASIVVPAAYKSGTSVTAAATFVGQTFASLGLTPGTYEYALGGTATDPVSTNTFTILIQSPVPLPASAPLFGAGLIALGAVGYAAKRKKAAATT